MTPRKRKRRARKFATVHSIGGEWYRVKIMDEFDWPMTDSLRDAKACAAALNRAAEAWRREQR